MAQQSIDLALPKARRRLQIVVDKTQARLQIKYKRTRINENKSLFLRFKLIQSSRNFHAMRKISTFLYLLGGTLLFLLPMSCTPSAPAETSEETSKEQHTSVSTLQEQMQNLVLQVRRQNRLYTTQCQVHKVVIKDEKARVGGKLFNFSLPGYRKIAIPIDVTLKAYIDFTRFSAVNVHRTDSFLIVTLPDPGIEVTASKIDHTKVREYVSIGRSSFSDEEINRLAQQGQDSILRHLNNYGIVAAARESATRTLVPLFRKMGFRESQIVLRFRRDYDDAALHHLITPLPKL